MHLCVCLSQTGYFPNSVECCNIPLKGGISLEVADVAARRRFPQFWDFFSPSHNLHVFPPTLNWVRLPVKNQQEVHSNRL